MADDTRGKCVYILNEFDRWLAVQVLHQELSWDELPKLNDMFREYFSDTRTEKKDPK